MHQKRYFYTKYLQKFSKERAMHPPQTSPQWGEGHPLPTPYPLASSGCSSPNFDNVVAPLLSNSLDIAVKFDWSVQ